MSDDRLLRALDAALGMESKPPRPTTALLEQVVGDVLRADFSRRQNETETGHRRRILRACADNAIAPAGCEDEVRELLPLRSLPLPTGRSLAIAVMRETTLNKRLSRSVKTK